VADAEVAPADETAGPLPRTIDGFTVEALLGHGSSGSVYLARQQRPERRVALKVLLGGGLGARGRERFEREIELLASVEHPNIPRLYGTGIWQTDAGSNPYLVMERVEGRSMMSHCESAGLRLRDRLGLLAAVARAVHHVHARGVVHRDLKPQNILVTARGVPMVLDFGVAKWRDSVEDGSALTRNGEVVGTLPYMSPEQIEGLVDIDLRSDVYALGIIGYELAAGRLPYPAAAFRTVVSALETLRHDPPEHQPGKLPVEQDLRTILAKAIAGERGDRYQSALEFALDLERYLVHEPILARRPTLAHNARLFFRRHRTASIAAMVALMGLGMGLVASVHFGLREQAALARADARAHELASTNDFLAEMLQAADPMRTGGNKVSMRSVLDKAREDLLAGDKLTSAVGIRVRMLLGATYVALGEQDTGVRLQEEALKRASADPAVEPELRNLATLNLGGSLAHTSDAARAISLLTPLLAAPLGSSEDSRRRWVHTRSYLEQAALAQSDVDAAERYAQQLGDRAERWWGAMDADALQIRSDRITIADFRDRHEEVLRDATQFAAEIATRLGKRHPLRMAMLATAGATAYHFGNLPLARQLLGEAADLNLEVYGPDALNTLDSQQRVAQVEHKLQPAARGPVAELRRIMETEIRVFGANDIFATASLNFYARALLDIRQPQAQQEAENLLASVVESVHGGKRPVTVSTLNVEARLAQLMVETGRTKRGAELYREVRDQSARTLGPQSDLVATADAALASLSATAPAGPVATRLAGNRP
jgi:hypothetical protein